MDAVKPYLVGAGKNPLKRLQKAGASEPGVFRARAGKINL